MGARSLAPAPREPRRSRLLARLPWSCCTGCYLPPAAAAPPRGRQRLHSRPRPLGAACLSPRLTRPGQADGHFQSQMLLAEPAPMRGRCCHRHQVRDGTTEVPEVARQVPGSAHPVLQRVLRNLELQPGSVLWEAAAPELPGPAGLGAGAPLRSRLGHQLPGRPWTCGRTSLCLTSLTCKVG